ncbi:glycoside hydrolase family 47 protein [Reticulomyxa filosa]|uniref:alpha-1,2-Mannosidase n=1 Tax=Reticulomyxa filosa TaxID=46433 RepID=X6NH52_RETFI|nr:glycoside hydrolase family 47 protein [Reticulomyxa filosa]|eukprot:ETO25059.1 glycoside hydrolase family 47 protein [Reticulomyxa filosa]
MYIYVYNKTTGPWYFEVNMFNSRPVNYHFNSLQAFWPSVQIMIGDIPLALSTIDAFYFNIWKPFRGLPERFLLNSFQLHSSERHYPLRPELIESVYYAYKAAKDLHRRDRYLWMGYQMLQDIDQRARTRYGHTTLNDVVTGESGDHMPSYFLAETCKYVIKLRLLFLLFFLLFFFFCNC